MRACDRAIWLGPGLKSCCVETIRRRERQTQPGSRMGCGSCTSHFYVDGNGDWRWLAPKPHAFVKGGRWGDYCKYPQCNAGPDALLHMVSAKAYKEWSYRDRKLIKSGTWVQRYGFSEGILGPTAWKEIRSGVRSRKRATPKDPLP